MKIKKTIRILILIFALHPIYTQNAYIKSDVAHLFSDKTGSSWLFNTNTGGSLNTKGGKITADAEYTKVKSTLEKASFDINSILIKSGYKNSFIDAQIFYSYFFSDEIKIKPKKEYYNQGLNGFSAGLKTDLTINNISISPFFIASKTDFKTKNGSFYDFYGSPEVPFLVLYGSGFSYKNSKLIAGGANIKLKIINEDDHQLFLAQSYCTFAVFIQKINLFWNNHSLNLTPFLSYLFLSADFSGALTSENQKYFLFPYKYYDIEGSFNANLLAAGLNSKYTHNNFSTALNSIIAILPQQDGQADISLKYKKNFLFDGSSKKSQIALDDLNLKGLVLLDSSLNYKTKVFHGSLNFKLSKLFFIPLNLSTASKKNTSSSSSSFSKDEVLQYILSAISFSVSYNF